MIKAVILTRPVALRTLCPKKILDEAIEKTTFQACEIFI
jgi:hypothetical protein